MKALGLLVAAVVALVLIDRLVDLARPLPDAAPAVATVPDAVQARLAVLAQVPLQAPAADAARFMAGTGFLCIPAARARYVDVTEAPGDTSRGPADLLRCDPSGGDGIATPRWQIVFEVTGGRVSHVGVAIRAAAP